MTGMIVTCPKVEADGHTLSPLAGQAVIANLMPEKFSVQAYPGADRIRAGKSGFRPTLWMASIPTIRLSKSATRATSRNTDRPVITS